MRGVEEKEHARTTVAEKVLDGSSDDCDEAT